MWANNRVVKLIAAAIVLTIPAYFAWWALWYRIPASAPLVIDKRADVSQPPYCLSFCAGLADNAHGFPGHCFVVWSTGLPADLDSCESKAYLTRKYWDQIPALWTEVPGRLISNAVRGNTRNMDRLSVLVNQDDYEKTRRACADWQTSSFRVGVRDCVTFTNSLAALIGLRTPDPGYVFPQDYIKRLKKLN